MKLTLSFIPDAIIAFRTITYHTSETQYTIPYKIWGDQAFWDCCGEYFMQQIKPMKAGMLFVQKNTLKWHVIEFEVDKDIDNVSKT